MCPTSKSIYTRGGYIAPVKGNCAFPGEKITLALGGTISSHIHILINPSRYDWTAQRKLQIPGSKIYFKMEKPKFPILAHKKRTASANCPVIDKWLFRKILFYLEEFSIAGICFHHRYQAFLQSYISKSTNISSFLYIFMLILIFCQVAVNSMTPRHHLS